MATNSSSKKVVPKIVTINKALQTAEMWVKNMTGGTLEERIEIDPEDRPTRLGLGARMTQNLKSTRSTDPVERKLLGKVNAKRKQNSEIEKTLNSNDFENEEDEDEPESRTSAFVKKKPMPLSASFPLVKKRK